MKKVSLLFSLLMVVSSIYAADVKNDGFYFNKLADGTLEITYANEDPTKNAKNYVGDLVIPEEVKGMKVTAIGDFAFSGCVKLTSITIPASVTSIGERAFWFCAILPKVLIPASVKEIKDYAFLECEKLTNVYIGNPKVRINQTIFEGCTELETAIVGSTSVPIKGHIWIHSEKEFYPNEENSSNRQPQGQKSPIYKGNSNIRHVTVMGVRNLPDEAFAKCPNLLSVEFISNVEKIGQSAFQDCTSLQEVIFKGKGKWSLWSMEKIEESCLQQLPRIPEGLNEKEKEDYVNTRLFNFKQIVLSSDKMIIGENAFAGCTNKPVITLPESMNSFFSGGMEFLTTFVGKPHPEIVFGNSLSFFKDYLETMSESEEKVELFSRNLTHVIGTEKDQIMKKEVITDEDRQKLEKTYLTLTDKLQLYEDLVSELIKLKRNTEGVVIIPSYVKDPIQWSRDQDKKLKNKETETEKCKSEILKNLIEWRSLFFKYKVESATQNHMKYSPL